MQRATHRPAMSTLLLCIGLNVTLLCGSTTHEVEGLYIYLTFIIMSCVI